MLKNSETKRSWEGFLTDLGILRMLSWIRTLQGDAWVGEAQWFSLIASLAPCVGLWFLLVPCTLTDHSETSSTHTPTTTCNTYT